MNAVGAGGLLTALGGAWLAGLAIGSAGQAVAGEIASISGNTFVVATKHGEVAIATDAGTNFHTPGVAQAAKQAGYGGYHDLTIAALKVGQSVGVMGERRDDGTLLARRVHLAKPGYAPDREQ